MSKGVEEDFCPKMRDYTPSHNVLDEFPPSEPSIHENCSTRVACCEHSWKFNDKIENCTIGLHFKPVARKKFKELKRSGIGGEREDDIEELIMGHEDELTTEEL
ncbi:hypothetical protein TNCV_230961 [Trichonephila clavipes]|nr:hypothetical protein TNCV_230961 [Trichonephila clavipes]